MDGVITNWNPWVYLFKKKKNLLSLISQSREESDGKKQMVGEITQDSELTFREHISQKMVQCTGWFHSEL